MGEKDSLSVMLATRSGAYCFSNIRFWLKKTKRNLSRRVRYTSKITRL